MTPFTNRRLSVLGVRMSMGDSEGNAGRRRRGSLEILHINDAPGSGLICTIVVGVVLVEVFSGGHRVSNP